MIDVCFDVCFGFMYESEFVKDECGFNLDL